MTIKTTVTTTTYRRKKLGPLYSRKIRRETASVSIDSGVLFASCYRGSYHSSSIPRWSESGNIYIYMISSDDNKKRPKYMTELWSVRSTKAQKNNVQSSSSLSSSQTTEVWPTEVWHLLHNPVPFCHVGSCRLALTAPIYHIISPFYPLALAISSLWRPKVRFFLAACTSLKFPIRYLLRTYCSYDL